MVVSRSRSSGSTRGIIIHSTHCSCSYCWWLAKHSCVWLCVCVTVWLCVCDCVSVIVTETVTVTMTLCVVCVCAIQSIAFSLSLCPKLPNKRKIRIVVSTLILEWREKGKPHTYGHKHTRTHIVTPTPSHTHIHTYKHTHHNTHIYTQTHTHTKHTPRYADLHRHVWCRGVVFKKRRRKTLTEQLLSLARYSEWDKHKSISYVR